MASEQGRAYGVFSAGPKFVKHLSKATQFNFLTEGFQTDCIQTNQEYISTLMSIGVKATTVQLVSTDHLTQLTVSKYRILKTMNLNISSLNNFDTLLCLFLSGFILGHAPFRAFHTSTCSWQPLGMQLYSTVSKIRMQGLVTLLATDLSYVSTTLWPRSLYVTFSYVWLQRILP